mmetsp:Transcript_12976/g.14061  ORF Transcript_12976/g.14061 Transcript_12976/m.14061 type:complete len:86 (+) Transcript_12976:77-334(+)
MHSCKLQAIFTAVHGTVVMHQLCKDTHRCFASEAAEVESGFGVPWAFKNSSRPSAQWKKMTWLREVLTLVIEVTQGPCWFESRLV